MNTSDRTLKELATEWVDLSRARAVRWESAFDTIATEQEQLWQSGRWLSGDDDLLSIIHRGRRERYHCAILRWLFDPAAPHLLGASILAEFLAAALGGTWDPSGLRRATARTEVSRTRKIDGRDITRIADLVVQAPGLFLVVEAKVDHHEDRDQCNDLYALFSNEDGARFVYLTPRGAAPPTARAAFARVGFHEVRRLLEGHEPPQHAPGAASYDSYRRTLRREFR